MHGDDPDQHPARDNDLDDDLDGDDLDDELVL
jgi:hypothetical protein